MVYAVRASERTHKIKIHILGMPVHQLGN